MHVHHGAATRRHSVKAAACRSGGGAHQGPALPAPSSWTSASRTVRKQVSVV